MEQHIEIRLEDLAAYEAKGFSTDGTSYTENGETLIKVQKNDVFDAAEMLCFDPQDSAVLTRTAFASLPGDRATLTITALGYFTPYVNGRKLTEEKLIPAKSDYRERDLSHCSYPIFNTMSHRVYYYEYDITPYLTEGKNVLCAHIGAGWYADNKNPAEEVPLWGENMLLFVLAIKGKDGKERVIASHEDNTLWQKSYIRSTSLYYGEHHDYNFYKADWNKPDFDDAAWKRPTAKAKFSTFFRKADFPGDRELGRIKPKIVRRTNGRILYDLGEIAAGWPVVRSADARRKNMRILLRYGDKLDEYGELDLHYTGGDWRAQIDCFMLTPPVGEAHVEFTWHASRYIELTGPGEIAEFIKVNTPIMQIGSFESDNETLNWLFNAYVNTQQANIHGSIPSDCPHRERLGYTGDGQLCTGAAMSVFDMRKAYKKWMQDIRDGQDIYTGHVQHTAPFFGGGGGPGGWGGAAVIVPWRYYQFYNDVSVLEDAYRSMQGYIRYMLDHSENGLVVRGEKGGWCLGDWCPPKNKIELPTPYVNTYFFIKCLAICEQTALLLDRPADAAGFAALKEKEIAALNAAYFDAATGSYCGGVQGADAFALDLKLGDERTKENLIQKYRALGEFDTGIFGTDLVIRTLFRLGEGSLAFRLLTNETENSFYNMKQGGTNTLWENWDGCDSLCHPMFGAVIEYLFSEIAGIKRYDDLPGFGDVTIRPADIPELRHVKCTFRPPEGEITVVIDTDENGNRGYRYDTFGQITVHWED